MYKRSWKRFIVVEYERSHFLFIRPRVLQNHSIKAQRLHIPKTNPNKKYLFIGGLGRSGTTALGRLLNISSKIALYTELHRPYRIDGYSQHELTEEVVSKTPKSHLHYRRNATILRKSIDAEFVGDKRPSFQFCAESSFDNLGIANTKCIYIDRSLVDICRSSHKQSENLLISGLWREGLSIQFFFTMQVAGKSSTCMTTDQISFLHFCSQPMKMFSLHQRKQSSYLNSVE